VIDAAVEAVRARAEGFGVQIIWHVPKPIVIEADPLRLDQAMLNLLENALKYGGSGDASK
jgi:signal transduction histidine kinase